MTTKNVLVLATVVGLLILSAFNWVYAIDNHKIAEENRERIQWIEEQILDDPKKDWKENWEDNDGSARKG